MVPAPHTQHSPSSTMLNSSSTTAHAAPSTNGDVHAPKDHHLSSPSDTVSAPVNRKKQKRRQKQAARLAERQLANGHVSTDDTTQNGSSHANPERYHSDDGGADGPDHEQPTNGDVYDKDGQDSMDAHVDSQNPQGPNGTESSQKSTGRKSKKKKGKKARNNSHAQGDETSTPMSTPSVSMSHPLPPPLPSHLASHNILKPAKNRSIWNTSTQEERENIKTFWLELGEEERRQLVKVEKDAVLKKMKEQQRHSCSCTVCGRKRTAIEEELEVLYDAYYEELEQYANHNQGSFEKGSPMVPPPRLYQPPLRSPGQHTRTQGQFHPSRGRIHELTEEDDDLEEDYDEEEDDGDEPYSDEELDEEDEETRAARADFFAFGNSLTVKDGILTVADDLLKNDGKHFIDMMEQLAERRMQREEDTQYGIAAAHESLHSGHNHGPFDDEDYDDEEDEDYDSQEEEDYEEDEMVCPGVVPPDAMTEEQRMEEGRRMFQIFAARMFEQRVLTAYREKVAEQRQQKLIEELMEEETRNEQRNAKKAREAQKRKDKKRLQKQAKEEERARREAEKAAEEAAAKAEQEKKLEEQRKKREEQRKKKEAERKAQEEERARKEAEKLRRQREERERQAEAERKQREEKKRREEARRKEKEERELREKKAKEERDRKAQEEQAKKDTAKGGEEAKDQEKRDDQAKRSSQQGPVPIPSNLHHLQGFSPAVAHSPHVPSATPVLPKAPTPARPRQPSQQDSHSSSPHSQAPSTDPSQASLSPRSMPVSQSSGVASGNSQQGHGLHAMLHQPQPSTPLSPLGRSIPPGFSSVNGIPPNPPGLSGMVARPPVGHDLPSYPPHSGPFISPFRGYPAPSGIPAPPGINGARPMPPGRGFPLEPGQGFAFHGQQIPGAFSTPQGGLPHRHSRQPSGSLERSPLENHAQPMPISRPSPIKRPSSTQQDQQKGGDRTTQRDVDDLSAHLGSSALLDDTDVPLSSTLSQSLPGATAPGTFPGPARASFGGPSLFPDPLSASKHANFAVSPAVSGGTWGAQIPFGTSAFPSAQTWGTGHASGWSNNAFGSGGHHRAHTSRPVAIRLLVIQACKQLNTMSPFKGADGYHDVNLVLRQVEQLRPQNEPSISLKEMLDICDTEGNTQNGGGTFSIKKDETREFVKFEPDNNSAASGHRGSIVPGEIGSPVPSSSLPAFGGIGTPSVLRQYSSPPMGF